MNRKELTDWFCSLSVKQKEHIACKVLMKQGKDPKNGLYPQCVNVWNELDDEKQQSIYVHCTDQHGMWIQEAGDGPIYSF